jgi:hypothetical protein
MITQKKLTLDYAKKLQQLVDKFDPNKDVIDLQYIATRAQYRIRELIRHINQIDEKEPK